MTLRPCSDTVSLAWPRDRARLPARLRPLQSNGWALAACGPAGLAFVSGDAKAMASAVRQYGHALR